MLSRDAGAAVTSSAFEDASSPAGGQLVQMIRQGQSFSGREKNCVFLNTGASVAAGLAADTPIRFANVSFISGLDFPDDARAVASVDWDHDGDLDFWFANRNGPQVRFLRNNGSSENHFIALRLNGTRGNRDAIGARVHVELEGDVRPLVRTLRAGTGYLTQSSKWLHFGLGPQATIRDVTVEWPGGDRQRFDGLAVDRHYTVTEGEGAEVWQASSRTGSLVATPVSLPTPTEQAAIYSTTRMPVPRLSWEKDGAVQPITAGQPTLIVLWASYCQPCIEELARLADYQTRLASQNVRVLVLSVDKLGATGGNPEAAQALLQRLRLPYETGYATQDTVEKLQLMNDFLFLLQTPLPIPSSFLADEDYRLAAIYRGPLSADRLLEDVQRLKWDQQARRDASVPFPGKWIGQPKTMRLAPFVVELARAGYLVDASEYVQRMQNQFDPATLLDLVIRLGIQYQDQGSQQHAQLHYQMARKISPGTIEPELRLGTHRIQQRRYADALRVLEQVVQRHPRNAQARIELAWLLTTCPNSVIQDVDRAIELLRPMLEAKINTPRLLDAMAAALAAQGNFAAAVAMAENAAQIAHRDKRFRLSSDIQRRLHRYQNGQTYQIP